MMHLKWDICVPSSHSTRCSLSLFNSYSRRLLGNGFHQHQMKLMEWQSKKKKKGILMMLQQRRVARRLFHLGGHGFATPMTQLPSSSLLLFPAFFTNFNHLTNSNIHPKHLKTTHLLKYTRYISSNKGLEVQIFLTPHHHNSISLDIYHRSTG